MKILIKRTAKEYGVGQQRINHKFAFLPTVVYNEETKLKYLVWLESYYKLQEVWVDYEWNFYVGDKITRRKFWKTINRSLEYKDLLPLLKTCTPEQELRSGVF